MIHFIGIGGVGMAALAVLEKALGRDATGCDAHASARTRWLEAQGIRVDAGHAPAHLAGADMVVATPAVPPDSPELAAARALGIPVAMRGEELARIASERDTVAVCGSHGKTTTATFTAKLLLALGENASWAIGGETGDFPVARAADGFASGTGPLVVEADESDGTLALYHSSILVVTNCEYDHPDHFRTPAEYRACFDAARRNAADVIEAESLDPDALARKDGFAFLLALPPHNRRNAAAAAEVAFRRGHRPDAVAAALASIVRELPDRRFQTVCRSDARGTVVTDYAHHPTEMRCAIEMARRAAPGGFLRVLFQPHRHSRTKSLLEDFPSALSGADEVAILPTYAAFEKPMEGGTAADLYAACRRAWAGRSDAPRLMLARTPGEAWRHAFLESSPGDIMLLLGAGSIVALADRAKADFASNAAPRAAAPQDLAGFSFFRTGGRTFGGGERIPVGMGSNTWIGDFSTDAEYFRPEGRASLPGASLGIPWMAGIPGTIGGWIRMNAGAHGHSISELVVRVKADGRWLAKDECGFGYRTSTVPGTIEDAEFTPFRDDAPVASYLAKRRAFPPRCCGSVFKNPPGGFAGRLLEECGAKGLSVGGASVWDGHANVVFARDGATSSDILALVSLMRARVFFRTGTLLEYEICGFDSGSPLF